VSEAVARRRLGLAVDRLRAAQALLAAGHPADAVDRAYAAILQAARAALVAEGVTPTSEDDAVSRFRLLYAKGGRIEGTGSEITDARTVADALRTGDGIEVDDVRARRVIDFAAKALGAVGEAIRAKVVEAAAETAIERDISALIASGVRLTPEKEAIVRELDQGFEGDRRMVIRYLQEFGWSKVVSANLRKVREAVLKEDEARRAASAPAEASADGKDPFYEVACKCFFCGGPEWRTRVMRGKVVQTVYRYETPEYPLLVEDAEAPLKGYRLVDPLLCAAHVCPTCLFASTSLLHFETDQKLSGENLATVLGTKRVEKLKEALDRAAAQRFGVVERLGLSGFHAVSEAVGARRGPREARAALELAGLSCEAEGDFLSNALFDAGKAYVAAARLSRDLRDGRDEEFLGRALRMFEAGYMKTTQVAQTAYLLGVLQARLGRWREARQHAGRILTDRKLNDRVRYKAWAENLAEAVRKKIS
jgi:uncharacterized protein (UPF0332 family)